MLDKSRFHLHSIPAPRSIASSEQVLLESDQEQHDATKSWKKSLNFSAFQESFSVDSKSKLFSAFEMLNHLQWL